MKDTYWFFATIGLKIWSITVRVQRSFKDPEDGFQYTSLG